MEADRVLAETYGWHIRDNDETDIESFIPFVFHVAAIKSGKRLLSTRRAYCDDVNWL